MVYLFSILVAQAEPVELVVSELVRSGGVGDYTLEATWLPTSQKLLKDPVPVTCDEVPGVLTVGRVGDKVVDLSVEFHGDKRDLALLLEKICGAMGVEPVGLLVQFGSESYSSKSCKRDVLDAALSPTIAARLDEKASGHELELRVETTSRHFSIKPEVKERVRGVRYRPVPPER